MFKHRSNQNPLLLTYLIDPESQPKESGRVVTDSHYSQAMPKIPVLGIAIVLPKVYRSLWQKESRERILH